MVLHFCGFVALLATELIPAGRPHGFLQSATYPDTREVVSFISSPLAALKSHLTLWENTCSAGLLRKGPWGQPQTVVCRQLRFQTRARRGTVCWDSAQGEKLPFPSVSVLDMGRVTNLCRQMHSYSGYPSNQPLPSPRFRISQTKRAAQVMIPHLKELKEHFGRSGDRS